MLSLSLGPLALSVPHLVLLLALGAALLVARCCAPVEGKRQADSSLFWLFVLAVVVARLGFVALYLEQYRATPWQAIDLRDGGFIPWLGIVVALAAAGVRGWRRPLERRALRWGLATGLAIWLAGGGLLLWQRDGSRLPQQPLTDTQGVPASLERYRGQPLVVNLWASWCPPCRREMPALVAAQAQRPDIRFVYINQRESPATAASFLGAAGVSPDDVLYDGGASLAKQVGAMALPTTLFYDRDGRLLGSHLGELSPASLAHALEVFGR
ncbi:TlpA disulfide reductase family protein [Pseudomonas sp. RIT-PI-S]|uniref:TlpA disulfide reductase family protein n=1 Tax=Pseudomonas sp. RIT-PI-S TaxID=3035295 RepID=UPI0021DB190C|nr:TlpA disulfide reductase family protein [Pseudomonas sp. RIT-PI-S]